MSPRPAITVLVADDHVFLREGIRAVIETQDDLQVVAEAGDGEAAVRLYGQHRPDVVLMDLQMPGMGGLEAIAAIRRAAPEARIIVLTTYAGDVQAMKALRAGAAGYLLKSSLRKELLDTIRAVHGGARRLAPEVAAGIALNALQDAVTPREAEVLALAAEGCSNKLIAARLGVSEETVKGHLKLTFAKLGASDRTQAVTIALRRGVIEI